LFRASVLANSLKAFEEGTAGERRIVIATAVDDGWLTIRAMDNGPGIQGLSVEDIWLPGETTYPNGTGLGLTIVRDTVNDLGGSVSAIAHGELGGAEIIINIPILGA
jgi:C4-dicarboxylate-specific signal transduction histidine kinase